MVLAFACGKSEPPGASPRASASAAAMIRDATAPAVKAELHPSAPPRDLNVLLISVDCLRADMPWAGYDRPIAPILTALEKRSVSYTHAYSLSSYTSMSLGGLLGGRYPGEMKRDGNFFGKYRDNVLFPERLQKAGNKTLSAHAHLYF